MPEVFNNLFQNKEDIILFILAIIILFILLGCVYAFFSAIFLIITSKGEDEKLKKAWNTLRYMLLGLFVTIFFLFFGPQLAKFLADEDTDTSVYTAKNVFKKMGDIISTTVGAVTLIIKNYPDGTADFSSLKKNDTSLTTEKIYL